MSILLANIPFIKHDERGNIYTGPNAGSRWPWTMPGISDYACFPFFMAYAVSYLRHHGCDAHFYDAVALRHWDYELVKQKIAEFRPEILVLEVSTPLYRTVREFAIWAKEHLACRIVFVGPHTHTYGRELIHEPFVDHCVIGEYEKPLLDIARKESQAETLYVFDHLSDINYLDGENFLPYRPLEYLANYWDPSMQTPRPQLQINTSRGCPFKCTYCQWPKVMNNGQYRNRLPELVLDEIKSVIQAHGEYVDHLKASLADSFPAVSRDLVPPGEHYRFERIQSILFDDDTWNIGDKRVEQLSRGLAEIGLPWTMMGRLDTSKPEVYDVMVESGCVGLRFGVETFNQRLLDNVKKRLNATKSFETAKYLLTRYSNMEFHFTSMKNLPGQMAGEWEQDLKLLNELRELGERNNNRVHWQNSDCIAFPGTELWEEMVSHNKGDQLRDFDLYDGGPHNMTKLAEAIGWLGQDYQPKMSTYSKMGEPTNLPRE